MEARNAPALDGRRRQPPLSTTRAPTPPAAHQHEPDGVVEQLRGREGLVPALVRDDPHARQVDAREVPVHRPRRPPHRQRHRRRRLDRVVPGRTRGHDQQIAPQVQEGLERGAHEELLRHRPAQVAHREGRRLRGRRPCVPRTRRLLLCVRLDHAPGARRVRRRGHVGCGHFSRELAPRNTARDTSSGRRYIGVRLDGFPAAIRARLGSVREDMGTGRFARRSAPRAL
jgi:hypothetical protein